MTIIYNIMYNGQIEPDYETTYFYEFIDKSFTRMSFKELSIKIGANCIKYIELEGGRPSADFYINDTFDMKMLIKKYNYFSLYTYV